MHHYLHLVDTDTIGLRNDVTPLFVNAEAFAKAVSDLAAPFDPRSFDLVAGIDALGFVLGAALALHAKKGFLAIRKGGKLPSLCRSVSFRDYSAEEKTLSVRLGAIPEGSRILVVDDWVETGAQLAGAIALIEQEGGHVIGVAALNIDDSQVARALRLRYQCHSLWHDKPGGQS